MSHSTTTPTTLNIPGSVGERSGFNDLTLEEQIEMLDELGSLALEGALLRFLIQSDEVEQKKFEAYVKEHIAEDDFLESLYKEYPSFEEVLRQEVVALHTETENFLRE
jgi:hypothetical protein